MSNETLCAREGCGHLLSRHGQLTKYCFQRLDDTLCQCIGFVAPLVSDSGEAPADPELPAREFQRIAAQIIREHQPALDYLARESGAAHLEDAEPRGTCANAIGRHAQQDACIDWSSSSATDCQDCGVCDECIDRTRLHADQAVASHPAPEGPAATPQPLAGMRDPVRATVYHEGRMVALLDETGVHIANEADSRDASRQIRAEFTRLYAECMRSRASLQAESAAREKAETNAAELHARWRSLAMGVIAQHDEVASLRASLERATQERDSLITVVEDVAQLLDVGSLGVPADSEAASWLHGTISEGVKQLRAAVPETTPEEGKE